ncbi:MAG TPA: hypothetical protein VFY75_01675 [Solirubrobacterales bacterium]|nr:hypothetical protein [Solirubrobacterales bacterium]
MKYVKILGLLAVAAALMAFAGTASATTVTSPVGTSYGTEKTLHATAGLTELHGEAFSVNCKTSTVAGKIEVNGAKDGSGNTLPASGPISTLDFSECSFPVTVTANGSLSATGTSGGNGTLKSTGAKVTIHGPFGINCLYETNNTDVGSLTGSTTTKGTAKLDIDSSLIPRTGDSIFCGSFGEWTGSYTVTTPDEADID